MERKVSHIFRDILLTIERVQLKTDGKTFADFQSDWETFFIIQRAIEIISEATRRLPDELKTTRPEIDWRSVAGIGNVLRHEYHTISDKIIWDVVQSDLPLIEAALEATAASEGNASVEDE
jgi:uncharacterized protein with HEPN domain